MEYVDPSTSFHRFRLFANIGVMHRDFVVTWSSRGMRRPEGCVTSSGRTWSATNTRPAGQPCRTLDATRSDSSAFGDKRDRRGDVARAALPVRGSNGDTGRRLSSGRGRARSSAAARPFAARTGATNAASAALSCVSSDASCWLTQTKLNDTEMARLTLRNCVALKPFLASLPPSPLPSFAFNFVLTTLCPLLFILYFYPSP